MSKPRRRRVRPLKLGHLYEVDWEDHFMAKTFSDDRCLEVPAMMRTYGRLVGETPTHFKIEVSHRTDQGRPCNATTFGIMKTCVVHFRDLGPDRK